MPFFMPSFLDWEVFPRGHGGHARDYLRGDGSMRSLRCIIVSAFVLVCLMAGSAQALPVRPAPSVVSEAVDVLDTAWDWLVGRLRPAKPAPRQDRSGQQKYGCGIDPD